MPRPEQSCTTFSSNLAFHAISHTVLEPPNLQFSQLYLGKPLVFTSVHHQTINVQQPTKLPAHAPEPSGDLPQPLQDRPKIPQHPPKITPRAARDPAGAHSQSAAHVKPRSPHPFAEGCPCPRSLGLDLRCPQVSWAHSLEGLRWLVVARKRTLFEGSWACKSFGWLFNALGHPGRLSKPATHRFPAKPEGGSFHQGIYIYIYI